MAKFSKEAVVRGKLRALVCFRLRSGARVEGWLGSLGVIWMLVSLYQQSTFTRMGGWPDIRGHVHPLTAMLVDFVNLL